MIWSVTLRHIKTSTYFAQVATPLVHDFYIIRLFAQGHAYTLVVLLQPSAWDENGDTIDGRLETIVMQLPTPIRIRQARHELVALDYAEWKRRILTRQGAIQ
jgi:hypothetical protein